MFTAWSTSGEGTTRRDLPPPLPPSLRPSFPSPPLLEGRGGGGIKRRGKKEEEEEQKMEVNEEARPRGSATGFVELLGGSTIGQLRGERGGCRSCGSARCGEGVGGNLGPGVFKFPDASRIPASPRLS